MFCKKCGKKIEGDTKFCNNCGTAVIGVIKADIEKNAVENLTSNPVYSVSESYLSKVIKEKSKRRLFFGCALIIVAVIIFIYQSNYIANLFSGPRAMSAESLESELLSGNIKDVNVGLQLPADGVYDSGYTHITQTVDQTTNNVESTTTDSGYYITMIGSHLLVIEGIPGQLPSGYFTGVIVSIDSELQQKLISDFNSDPKLKDISSSILPYMLSNRGMFGLDGAWAFFFGLALLCWGGIVVFRRATNINDRNHEAYKILASCNYNNIDEFSEDFQKDKNAGITRIGKYDLSNKFLFQDSFFSFSIYPMSQLFWAYKKVVKKSVNFIPTGKDYRIVLHFRPNKKIETNEPEDVIIQHLLLIASRYPWVKLGYTK